MSGDHESVLVTARCSKCGRTVSTPLAELRATGVFGCICGVVTRARYMVPPENAIFGGRGWLDPGDAYPRSAWR